MRGRSRGLISPNHILTLAGIFLGVAALICVSSVMNGFRDDIGLRIAGTMAEIRIAPKTGGEFDDYQQVLKQVRAKGYKASAVIRSELLIKRESLVLPTICFGIVPADHAKVSKALGPLSNQYQGALQGISSGRLDSPVFEENGIILSAGLAHSMGVNVGDQIQLISPRLSIPTAFGMIPRVKSFRVTATFQSAMPEYQQSYAYISLDNARFYSNIASVEQIQLSTPDFVKAERYAKALQSELPGLKVEPWSRFDASLYSAIRFEKFLMFVIMLLMYVIASFNLTGSMLKSIAQKKRELGLLKAIGLSDPKLRQMFLRQSFILSTIGIASGVIVASILLVFQAATGFVRIGSGVGSVNLPVKIMVTDYLVVVLVSYVLTYFSVLLPLRRLREVDPIALIRQTT